jgi:uncharacterized membrane protein (UPF0127 family)
VTAGSRAAGLVLVAAVAAGCGHSTAQSAQTGLTGSSVAALPDLPTARLHASGAGTTYDGCVLVAADAASRGRGLMDVTSLGRFDGMAFRWSSDQTARFYMFRTLIPLSIAFINAKGTVVGTDEMTPCPDQVADRCPLYGPSGPYAIAIEAAAGGLGRIGLGVGAQVSLGGTC